VALVGGGDDIVALARAARQLQAGEPVGHPELVGFGTWEDVQHYAEHDPAGSDLAVAVKLIDRHGPEAIVDAIRACVPEGEADRTISTAHKAKGREWSSVLVADDFREPRPDPDTGEPGPIVREEAMLAYVTVTRAMGRLDVGSLAWIHDRPEATGIASEPSLSASTSVEVTTAPTPVGVVASGDASGDADHSTGGAVRRDRSTGRPTPAAGDPMGGQEQARRSRAMPAQTTATVATGPAGTDMVDGPSDADVACPF
jgi:hypothetical protein